MMTPCIILFDGGCHLCDRFVQWVIPRDPAGLCYFAAVQSEAGAALMERYGIAPEEGTRSIQVIAEGKVYGRSGALIVIASRLRLPWRLAAGLGWIPRGIRDCLYRLVSANRYRWFGQREECRIPEPHERERFLQVREDLSRVKDGGNL